MNRNLASLLTSSLFMLNLAMPAKAENTLEKIQRTGVINLAIRPDAAPFGYLDSNRKLQGYCLDFFALMEQQLVKKLNRNTLSIKLFKSTARNRFTLVANDIVDLECGPNTIRANPPDGVSFSTSFFVTGTQFLVNRNNRINPKGDLDEIRLGVVSNTTTEKFVTQRYPLAIVRKYSGAAARNRGVEAVEQGKIDAMVSDGILLRAEAEQQGLSSSNYPLIPNIPLTCDRYGIIIHSDDPEWQDFIDSVIDSPEAKVLSNVWFGKLFNYTEAAAANICPR